MASKPAGNSPAPKKAPSAADQPAAQDERAGKAAPDWERIEPDYRAGIKTLRQIAEENEQVVFPAGVLADIAVERALILACGQAKHGTECDLVRQFLELHGAGCFDERLPQQSRADAVIKEYAFRHGRADVILFHQDGTATVIEAKDGTKGYTHVASGIGQCSLYAAQLGAKPGVVRAVRRALMWTSVGSSEGDAMIEDVCALAGVIPLPYPATAVLMATRMATEKVIAGAKQPQEVDHGRA